MDSIQFTPSQINFEKLKPADKIICESLLKTIKILIRENFGLGQYCINRVIEGISGNINIWVVHTVEMKLNEMGWKNVKIKFDYDKKVYVLIANVHI